MSKQLPRFYTNTYCLCRDEGTAGLWWGEAALERMWKDTAGMKRAWKVKGESSEMRNYEA